MKVNLKKLDNDMVRLEVVATPAEVNDAYDQAQLMFAQQMNVPFEEGKTIAEVAAEKIGIKDLDAVVKPQIVECLIPLALDKKNIIPAYPATANPGAEPKRGSEFSFSFTVAPKPDYELSSYEPVSITVPPLTVEDWEIEAQITQMAESYAEYVTEEPRPVEEGDSFLLSMECSDNGTPIPALTMESRAYTTGAGLMPPSFDENVIGMNVGETKSFTFSGPTFDKAGNETEQSLDCTVTIKELQKKVIPAINDAWLEKNMPLFPNVAMLKEGIKSQIIASREQDYETYKQQLATAELSKRFEGKIADAVYEAMQQNLVNNIKMQLQQQNISYEQFVQQNGGEQQFGMMLMMQTRQNLVDGYSLDALFRHEKMTLTDEDIMAACKAMNPQQPELVKEQMEKAGYGFALRENASRIKASAWLVEHANITVETKE